MTLFARSYMTYHFLLVFHRNYTRDCICCIVSEIQPLIENGKYFIACLYVVTPMTMTRQNFMAIFGVKKVGWWGYQVMKNLMTRSATSMQCMTG